MSPAPDADTPDELADQVAAAALAVPGVHGLHAGSFGEVGTYLPGRRVAGIRLAGDLTEVHLAVVMGSPIPDLAAAVATAVSPLVDTPVQVFVEDVVPARTDQE
ncbi:hypothetical protein [Aeromicrobium sp. Leaf350]|uniref:hypothetical protein n=1 Tax=Aeromicrobium sp. Leaf350 TaxID=2876565 RepID=UPI001E299CC1|nr:hypothetical protein [Aeromicrobium sp. Leaf350]